MTTLNNIQIAKAGLYLAMSELTRRGYEVEIVGGSRLSVNIDEVNSFAVRVRTSHNTGSDWSRLEQGERIGADFYIVIADIENTLRSPLVAVLTQSEALQLASKDNRVTFEQVATRDHLSAWDKIAKAAEKQNAA